jgi:hypothetical protein
MPTSIDSTSPSFDKSAPHELPTDLAWRTVLRQLALRLDEAGIAFTVVGGTAAALHGVPLPVKDVDLEMDAAGAYRFQELFAPRAMLPVAWREGQAYRSHFGRFDFDGVTVEVMGDLQRRRGDGWVPTMAATRGQVDLDGVRIAVPWLEEETLANLRRGRLERAAQYLAYCDSALMQALLNGEQKIGVL